MKITHNTLGLLVFLIISNFLCYMDKNIIFLLQYFIFQQLFAATVPQCNLSGIPVHSPP